MNPTDKQYENRLKEVLTYDISIISTQDDILNFLNKIVDFVEFIERNGSVNKRIKRLYGNKEFNKTTEKLLKKGDELLAFCSELFHKADTIVKEAKINLPTEDSVIKAHLNKGVYSPTVDESLGSNLDRLRRLFNSKSKTSISEVSGIGLDTLRIKWDFDALGINAPFTEDEIQKLNYLREDIKGLEEDQERERRFQGINHYDLIRGIWEKQTGKNISKQQLSFLLSPVNRAIDNNISSYMSTPTYIEIKAELSKYKDSVKAVDMRLKESEARRDYAWYRRLWRGSLGIVWKVFKWIFNFVTINTFK